MRYHPWLQSVLQTNSFALCRTVMLIFISGFSVAGKYMCSPSVSSDEVRSASLINTVTVLYKSDSFIVINKHFDLKINSDDPEDVVTVATLLCELYPALLDKTISHGFRFVIVYNDAFYLLFPARND